MIILFKAKRRKKKRKETKAEGVLSTDLFICAHIGVRCGNTVIIIVVFILQPRCCWTTLVSLSLLLFFFLFRVKCREMFKCRTTAFRGGEGLLRGSSHFQFAVFCKQILIKNVKQMRGERRVGKNKQTKSLSQ